MKVHRAHKIELKPNNAQAKFLARSCGTARVGYNTALAIWNKEYEAGNKPTMYSVKKQLNAVKKEQFPWAYEVSKCCMESAVMDLGKAFKNFFKVKGTKHPGFHKKGRNDSFTLNNLNFSVLDDSHIRIAKLKTPLHIYEPFRFKEGKLLSCTISRKADRWFASVCVELEVSEPTKRKPNIVGVDLGIKTLAVLSDGREVAKVKAHEAKMARLRQLNKSLARKQKGSNNWKKTAIKLGRLHMRIANIRKNALHKLTSQLVRDYSVVVIEDLNVKGMSKNRHLARSILDAGFGSFRTMLEYKAKATGTIIGIADRFYPSSKTCSGCGKIHDMPLSKRTMACDCGLTIDRDLNAAINLRNLAVGRIVSACGQISSGDSNIVKLSG